MSRRSYDAVRAWGWRTRTVTLTLTLTLALTLILTRTLGDTALHCCMPDHEELAKYLLSKGAEGEAKNNEGKKWNE